MGVSSIRFHLPGLGSTVRRNLANIGFASFSLTYSNSQNPAVQRVVNGAVRNRPMRRGLNHHKALSNF
jgi:hypothetical protein